MGLRLAYQLERALDAQVIVAATEAPGDQDHQPLADPPQVRVIGVSGRGDRRLLDMVVPEIGDLARVARARRPQPSWKATRWAAWSPTGDSAQGP